MLAAFGSANTNGLPLKLGGPAGRLSFPLRASVRDTEVASDPIGYWIGFHAAAPCSLLNDCHPRPLNAVPLIIQHSPTSVALRRDGWTGRARAERGACRPGPAGCPWDGTPDRPRRPTLVRGGPDHRQHAGRVGPPRALGPDARASPTARG